MQDTAVDFLWESLIQLRNSEYPWISNNPLILAERDQLECLYEELGFLRSFIKDSEEKHYDHEETKDLVKEIAAVAYKANDIVDLFVAGAVIHNNQNPAFLSDDHSLELGYAIEKIKSIKAEVMEIYKNKMCSNGAVQVKKSPRGSGSSSRGNTPVVEEDIIVGFDDDAKAIVERLARDQKQLQMIPIIGMAGLGKTTLARRVYNDPFIVYHFYIRAWVYVSQTYQKRDLLLGILYSAFMLKDEVQNWSDEKLCEELYRRLKGKRYLIVIDDIWNMRAWDDLRRTFPNDHNGSRVVLTSRVTDVVVDAKPHFLRFLTDEESWELLQQKVFKEDYCRPTEWLIKIGKQIVKKCQGLPLAVVVIAGLLSKRDKTRDWWQQVAESVSSYIVSDQKQYMETLALSYNHLPQHLKPCFLYIIAFPERYEIPVRKLIWLWMAEGFIRPKAQQNLEEAAENCLMDLIDRSLLIVAQKRPDGGVKACRIHDLLRTLCWRKAEEENFLQVILKPETSRIRSYLCFFPGLPELESDPFTCQAFNLLRVLDLWSTRYTVYEFPNEIGGLVHLRYLALRAVAKNLPLSISNLWNLETLIIGGLSRNLALPYNIGKMVKLRHLHIRRQTSIRYVKDPTNYGYPFLLLNLQTISTILLHGPNQQVLSRIPNIRKLGCIFFESYNGAFPKLDVLIHLETLKVFYHKVVGWPTKFPSTFMFPSNLRKLTMSGFRLPWTEMSTIGLLPNLEVLKLLDDAFKGPLWNTGDDEFLQLKFLKFKNLDIEQWNASSIHFPSLHHLRLEKCKKLEEIPDDLGYISTLDMMEVYHSSHSAAKSARRIQQEQESIGNDGLKIFVFPRIEEDEIEEDSNLDNISR